MNTPVAYHLSRLRAPRWVYVLLLAVFVQAMVPAGYMPAVMASTKVSLPIVVCSQGMPTGFQPLNDSSHSPAEQDTSLQHCVFGANAPGTAAIPAPLLFSTALIHSGFVFGAPGFPGIPCAVCGPPLGSRAPPVFLVV